MKDERLCLWQCFVKHLNTLLLCALLNAANTILDQFVFVFLPFFGMFCNIHLFIITESLHDMILSISAREGLTKILSDLLAFLLNFHQHNHHQLFSDNDQHTIIVSLTSGTRMPFSMVAKICMPLAEFVITCKNHLQSQPLWLTR